MKKLNSKGFGIVEGLLALVIVALIGGVGYYVYSQKGEKGQDENSLQSEQRYEIPEGWAEYRNEQLADDRKLGVSFIYPEKYGEPTVSVNQEGELDEVSGLYEVDSISIQFEKAEGRFNILADNESGFKKEGENYFSKTGLQLDENANVPQLEKRSSEKGFKVVNDNTILWYSQLPVEGTEDVFTTVFASINLDDSDYKGIEVDLTLDSGVRGEKQTTPAKPTTQAEVDAALDEMTRILESFKQL